jgi:hypothetical protein
MCADDAHAHAHAHARARARGAPANLLRPPPAVPKELSVLRSLTELNVGENKLAVLPDLSKLTRMTRLAAHWNNLVVAPDVKKLAALEVRFAPYGCTMPVYSPHKSEADARLSATRAGQQSA